MITTIVSVAVGFEHKSKGKPEQIVAPVARELVASYAQADDRIKAPENEPAELYIKGAVPYGMKPTVAVGTSRKSRKAKCA